MTVGPRILFTRFVSGDSPKLQPWLSHSRRLLAADGRRPTPMREDLRDGAMVWQLVSGNNRQLARSARVYPTFAAATTGALSVIEDAQRLRVSLVSEHQRGVYGWFVTLDGEAVLTCARWYDTERDRLRSINLAVPSLSVAVLLSGSRLIDPALLSGSA